MFHGEKTVHPEQLEMINDESKIRWNDVINLFSKYEKLKGD